MTLKEMALEYRANNEKMACRLRELRLALKLERDPERRFRLKRRMAELMPMYREGRQVEKLLAGYYRGRGKNHADHC